MLLCMNMMSSRLMLLISNDGHVISSIYILLRAEAVTSIVRSLTSSARSFQGVTEDRQLPGLPVRRSHGVIRSYPWMRNPKNGEYLLSHWISRVPHVPAYTCEGGSRF